MNSQIQKSTNQEYICNFSHWNNYGGEHNDALALPDKM